MKHLEDICWDKVVERLDLVDPEDLARAEQRLAEVDAAPLSRDVVEKLVAEVAPRRILVFRRMKSVARIAAVVVAALMLTAGGYWLIWGGVRSQDTMPYAMAIEVLSNEGQPARHRQAALLETRGRVQHGIAKLCEVLKNTATDSPLHAAARARVDVLKRLLVGSSLPSPEAVTEDIVEAGEAMLDGERPVQERIQHLHHVADLTANGILAIRRAPNLASATETDRAVFLKKLVREIER
jgi:hypothetical protein